MSDLKTVQNELDAWLVQKINGEHGQCYPVCRPTANVVHALSLLETFMAQHKDAYTHVEIAYDPEDDFPWLVYLYSERGDYDPVASGYPLAAMICEALQKAIKYLEGK